MKVIRLLIPAIYLIALGACGHTENRTLEGKPAEAEMKMSAPADAAEPDSKTSFVPPEINSENESSTTDSKRDETITTDQNSVATETVKKIIKDGDVTIECKDIATSKKAVDAIVMKYQSYYLSENLSNNDSEISYELSIRIPSARFETFLSESEQGIGEITWKSIHARDVTEEFYDIQTRLKNKKDYLLRYKELLSKANTVKDIINIEESIRVLEEEIESAEGRLKFLNDQVAYSTLNLRLFQKKEFVYKPKPRDSFSERVKDSLNQSWAGVVEFVLMLITLWPFAVVAGIIIFLIIRKRKKA